MFKNMKISYSGNTKIAKLLIKNGANVNLVENDGETPLHWAAILGNL